MVSMVFAIYHLYIKKGGNTLPTELLVIAFFETAQPGNTKNQRSNLQLYQQYLHQTDKIRIGDNKVN